ncbi:MAG: hypothetical protein JWM64_259 [Frankiales bacterium]|nr:hypothetical protein [Frankiales bacterium]
MRTTARRRLLAGLLATAGVTAVVVPTAASADSTEYLVDRPTKASSVSVSTGEAVIAGTTYARSVRINLSADSQGVSREVSYDLGGSCKALTGTLGMTDTSEPASRVRFQVYADDRLAQEAVSGSGTATPLSADLSGAAVLRLVATVETYSYGTANGSLRAAFGDAVLRCSGTTPGRTTVTASAATVAAGAGLTVSGLLTDSGGSPVAGTPVEVRARENGDQGFTTVATSRTDDAGRWSAAVRPRYSTRYRAVVEATSTTAEVLGDTEPAVVVRSALSINAQRLGTRQYRFFGTLRPGKAGRTVSLFRRTGTKETLVSRTTTDDRGVYDVRRTFTGSGRFDFLVRFSADSYSTAATSGVRPTAVY